MQAAERPLLSPPFPRDARSDADADADAGQIMTRDMQQLELDAITEHERHDVADADYKGVLKVDVKSDGQYGLENWRYTPIFEKMVPGSFRASTPWIAHLPTPVLRLIRDHPVAFGRVRTFGLKGLAAGPRLPLGVLERLNATAALWSHDVAPRALLSCRHVKRIVTAAADGSNDWTDHFEYLVQFGDGRPAE